VGRFALKIMLDTNILIFLFEDIKPYAGKVEALLNSFMEGRNQGLISTINVAEVMTGFYSAGKGEEAAKAITLLRDLTINGLRIVPVSLEIADLAAKLRAERGGKLPDALVAATAIDQGAAVIYSQDRGLQRFSDYIKIEQLE
jgi:predicted nucleic acid-binding protein